MSLRFGALLLVLFCAVGLTLVCNVPHVPIRLSHEFAIGNEIDKLRISMDEFKAEFGMFPPADLRRPDNPGSPIYKFFAAAFPNYDIATPRAGGATRLEEDLQTEKMNYQDFDPAYSLVFWLVGFGPDAQNPLKGHARRMGWDPMEQTITIQPDLSSAFYEFEPDRLVKGHYFIPLTKGNVDRYNLHDDTKQNGIWDAGEQFKTHAAYLYFDADSSFAGLPDGEVLGYDGFQPYRRNANPRDDGNLPQSGFSKERRRLDPHFNDNSYQIISAGVDADLWDVDGDGQLEAVGLGRGGRPNAEGDPFGDEDADNITNFTVGTIGDFVRPRGGKGINNHIFLWLSMPGAILLLLLVAAVFVWLKKGRAEKLSISEVE
jgi:hypothetical protein